MSCEVVAVQWSCASCDATAITAPGDPPENWFEMPAPVWRASNPPSHHCPEHAGEAREMHRRRQARFEGRTHVVSVEEFERVRSAIGQAVHLLEQLKFSGDRAAGREID